MGTTYTQVGEELIVDYIDGTQTPGTHYIGWGTGSGADPPNKSSTALYTEAAEARVAATKSQPTADKNRWVGTMTASSAKTITNAGVFSASTGGTLILHGVHTSTALQAGDKIEYTFELEQT